MRRKRYDKLVDDWTEDVNFILVDKHWNDAEKLSDLIKENRIITIPSERIDITINYKNTK